MSTALVATLSLSACRGRASHQASAEAEGKPILIEDARPFVVSGNDTTVLYTPTLFAFFGLTPGEGPPSQASMDAARTFQRELRAAGESLDGLGVRVVAIQKLPEIHRMPPGSGEGEGPALVEGAFGYLFADSKGHLRRVTNVLSRNEIVCTAARTFGLTLPASQAQTCG